MVTVSHLAKKYVKDSFILREYMEAGIINYIALANRLKPSMEKELEKHIKASAIAMALRRCCDESGRKSSVIPSLKGSELIMKGNLCDVAVYKSPRLFEKLNTISEMVDYGKGDTLNIIHGNYDVSIIINEKYLKGVLSILKGEKMLGKEEGLVALTLKFGEHFLHTPGVTFSILKQLVLQNINLIDIVSSMIEITFIIDKSQSAKGYDALREYIESQRAVL